MVLSPLLSFSILVKDVFSTTLKFIIFHLHVLIETDRVVVAPPPSAVTKETSKQSKKTVRIAEGGPEVAMETNIVISHHSHSTVHGQVGGNFKNSRNV